MFELFGDPQVTRYWSFPAWTDVAQADAFLAPLVELPDDARSLPWAIADGITDELVGGVTLFEVRRDHLELHAPPRTVAERGAHVLRAIRDDDAQLARAERDEVFDPMAHDTFAENRREPSAGDI